MSFREESGGDQTDSLEGGEISPQKDIVDELPDTPDLLQYVLVLCCCIVSTVMANRLTERLRSLVHWQREHASSRTDQQEEEADIRPGPPQKRLTRLHWGSAKVELIACMN